MTPAENALWQRLRANQLEGLQFRRQQVIAGFIVDFYCHSAGLIVEVDGGIHRQRGASDFERDRVLEQRGLKILRFPNEAVLGDLEAVLDRIVQSRGGVT